MVSSKIGRPTNASINEATWLKEKFQEIDKKLNALEAIGQKSLEQQKDEDLGKIWLTIGKLMIMINELEVRLKVFDD